MFLYLFQILTLSLISLAQSQEAFKFHLIGEPQSLDPALSRGVSGSYLFNNVYSSLYYYDNKQGLVAEGAKACIWKTTKKLVCELNPHAKFSNDKPVKAKHYVTSFQRIFTESSFHTELLLNLKNARKILANKIKTDKLGVYAKDNKLIFEFDKHDADFLYKLTRAAFTPTYTTKFPDFKKANKLIHYGPYSIKKWSSGRIIELQPNTHYHWPDKFDKPKVKIYFVDSHETALRLFDTKRINFLRYLNSHHVPKYKNRLGFKQVSVARFDYIGFSGELKDKPDLRKALIESIKYPELQKIYHSKGQPGCPSLPTHLYDKVSCYKFKKKKYNFDKNIKYKIDYSVTFGGDIAKGMEWLQHQWKKHLNLNFELNPSEQGYFLNQLKNNKSNIFRKGVSLDRPTCLAALESFKSDSIENYVEFKNKKFDKIINALNSKSAKNKKELCQQGLKLLLQSHLIIPLGEAYFPMLDDLKFTGWTVNELNQLNLRKIRKSL